jgi:hypothetical protein
MGKRDETYSLSGQMELDNAFITTLIPDGQKDEPLKRGAGSQKEYLQYYLNEFCYKFNRRYFGEKLFDRLVTVAVTYPTDFKSKIYNRTVCG